MFGTLKGTLDALQRTLKAIARLQSDDKTLLQNTVSFIGLFCKRDLESDDKCPCADAECVCAPLLHTRVWGHLTSRIVSMTYKWVSHEVSQTFSVPIPKHDND